jgi:predicted acylesterase/phospholipase RssA/CRP-like cAMP-binding protein
VSQPTGGQSARIAEALQRLFGSLGEGTLREIAERVDWLHLRSGERLIAQGELRDDLFIPVTGRLQAVAEEVGAEPRVLGEISGGESAGEMALLTGEPRSASIYAVRDSVVVRLTREHFEELAGRHPELALNLARLVVGRLRRIQCAPKEIPEVRNIALVFCGPNIDRDAFTRRLARTLEVHGSVLTLDSHRFRSMFGGSADSQPAEAEALRLTAWLDAQEVDHRFVFYQSDAKATGWTRRCVRQADRILLVADSEDPEARFVETDLLAADPAVGTPRRELVVLHRDSRRLPQQTSHQLDKRTVAMHHQVRLDRDSDFERLARFIAGKAVGIAFAGGGARGFAHVGVVRALREAGVPIDMAGGTSIGALAAAAVACDWSQEELERRCREGFTRRNPLGDYNVLPLVSIVKGDRIESQIRTHFGDVGIEDMWLPMFCVSTNLSAASIEVHRTGLLRKAVRASLSLPGILPPVVYGNNLHVDGGTFDNLPVGVLRDLGAGRVIGSDLEFGKEYTLNYDRFPSTWSLVKDRYIYRRRRLKVPGSITTVYRSTVLTSLRKQREVLAQTDLALCSPAQEVGLAQWSALDRLVEIGYRHTRERLEAGGPELRARLGATALENR